MSQAAPRQMNIATRTVVLQTMDALSVILLAFAVCVTGWVIWSRLSSASAAKPEAAQADQPADQPYCMPGAPTTACACPWAKAGMCRALAQTSCAKLRAAIGQEAQPLALAAVLGAAQTGNAAFLYAPRVPGSTALEGVRAWVKKRAAGCTVVVSLAPGPSESSSHALDTGRWLAQQLAGADPDVRLTRAFGLHEYKAAFAGAPTIPAFADAAPIQFNLGTASQLSDSETERFLATALDRGSMLAVIVGRGGKGQ